MPIKPTTNRSKQTGVDESGTESGPVSAYRRSPQSGVTRERIGVRFQSAVPRNMQRRVELRALRRVCQSEQ